MCENVTILDKIVAITLQSEIENKTNGKLSKRII